MLAARLRKCTGTTKFGEAHDSADFDRPLPPLFAPLSLQTVMSAVLEIMQILGGVST